MVSLHRLSIENTIIHTIQLSFREHVTLCPENHVTHFVVGNSSGFRIDDTPPALVAFDYIGELQQFPFDSLTEKCGKKSELDRAVSF